MTFRLTPAPKPPAREKGPRKALPAISDRHDDPGFWRRRAREVIESQGGACAKPGCRRPATDCAHVEGLGRRATRHDADHSLNHPRNLLGLCRPDHVEFDRQSLPWRRENGREWKDRIMTPQGHGASRTGGAR